MLVPSHTVPDLAVETLDHGPFTLSQSHGAQGTFVVFYRGVHCPLCIKQMAQLEAQLDAFEALGLSVIMLSADDAERARQAADKAGAKNLRVGYGMDLKSARDDWGLLISGAREGTQEPEVFFEPAHMVITPDNRLYFTWQQSVPFARPSFDDLLPALKKNLGSDYPFRGSYQGKLPGDA